MMTLSGRKILLGVSGGIAAYKACEVVRRLRDLGAEVRVVMTESATRFISPLTFQALSGYPVRCGLFDEAAEAGMGHIELARWADLLVIAPGTANLMAKMATGQADDLLTTLVLATEAKVLLAPAMNRVMWENPAVQANAATLAARGVRLLGPAEGAQACGETGAGRMVEPVVIVDEVITHFTARQGPLAGKKVVITAGGTREPIDPVRFIANRSSGRMGYALAQAAVEAGAKVVLVSGPSTLAVPVGVECTKVETALQMLKAVQQALPADVFIGAAAVADYRVAEPAVQKIKKSDELLTLNLVRNPDILATVAASSPRPFVVGFAAETEALREHALDKLARKKLDMICANDVSEGRAFDQPDNTLSVFWPGGERVLAQADKLTLARQVMALIAEQLH